MQNLMFFGEFLINLFIKNGLDDISRLEIRDRKYLFTHLRRVERSGYFTLLLETIETFNETPTQRKICMSHFVQEVVIMYFWVSDISW